MLVVKSNRLHELLHGVGWVLSCEKGWKSIEFSFSSLMPLSHYKEPLERNRYMIGLLLPFLVLGVGVTAGAIFLGNLMLLIAASINFFVMGGDIMIAFTLLRNKDGKIFDHSSDPGYIIFSKTKDYVAHSGNKKTVVMAASLPRSG